MDEDMIILHQQRKIRAYRRTCVMLLIIIGIVAFFAMAHAYGWDRCVGDCSGFVDY